MGPPPPVPTATASLMASVKVTSSPLITALSGADTATLLTLGARVSTVSPRSAFFRPNALIALPARSVMVTPLPRVSAAAFSVALPVVSFGPTV